jgi:hypothetical protein
VINVIQLCPVCGSGKVQATEFLGDSVTCASCGWSGKDSGTVTRSLELGQAESIAETVALEYLTSLAVYAGAHIGRAMVAVGLVPVSDKQALARLIKAAVTGAHKATLAEIEQIQQEIKDGNVG